MSKVEVVQAYERYLEAFLADDLAAIDALVQYPLAYIGDGKVSMLDEYPIKPSALLAAKDWHTSVGMEFEVIGISETKAHLVLKRGTRVRRDGSPIEDIWAFYASGPEPKSAGRCSRCRTSRCRVEATCRPTTQPPRHSRRPPGE
jgi:hypothetical protein